MSLLYKSAKDVSIPVRLLCEHGDYDSRGYTAYEARLNALKHLLCEHQEADAYHVDEWEKMASPPPVDTVDHLSSTESEEHTSSVQEEITMPVFAETTIPTPPPRRATPQPEPEAAHLTRIQFRQALIEVDDPATFWKGVVGGQVAAVETEAPLTGTRIFTAFEDAVHDLAFSETWLAGYLLGLSDAWLRDRKLYPPVYTAAVKSLKVKAHKKRKKR